MFPPPLTTLELQTCPEFRTPTWAVFCPTCAGGVRRAAPAGGGGGRRCSVGPKAKARPGQGEVGSCRAKARPRVPQHSGPEDHADKTRGMFSCAEALYSRALRRADTSDNFRKTGGRTEPDTRLSGCPQRHETEISRALSG